MLARPGGDAPRLLAFPEVASILARAPEPVSLIKPLVESQHALQMLALFPNPKAVWLYRDVRPVALSNVRKFPDYNSAKLLNLLVQDRDSHWVNEGVTSEVQQTLRALAEDDLSDLERMALVWFARNHLYFDLELEARDDVILMCYEELIEEPQAQMRRLYGHLGLSYPGPRAHRLLHSGSRSKGRDVELRPEIDACCTNLAQRLKRVLKEQHERNQGPKEV